MMAAVREHSDEGRISANSLGSPSRASRDGAIPPADYFHGSTFPSSTVSTAENPTTSRADIPQSGTPQQAPLLDQFDHRVPVSAFAAKAGLPGPPSAKQMHISLSSTPGASPSVLAL